MKKIEDNLLAITNTIFRNKNDWKWVTDQQKETYFFIINRMFCKMYSTKSQLFNIKNIDKVSSMNLWYQFMLNKSYPKWFWSKSNKDIQKVSDKDFNLLLSKLKVKDIDLIYLIDKHFDFIKEELAYYKNLEKQK